MIKTVLTEEDRRYLRAIVLELGEVRKLMDELAETLVKMSDKELLKALNATEEGPTEDQMDKYKLSLEKQVDIAENEFRH